MTPLESTKSLLSQESEASLGTLEDQIPFVSAASYLFEPGTGERVGPVFLLLSDLARHTKNIQKNRTVSLLVVATRPEVPLLERERATVVGEIERLSGEGEITRLRENYLKRFPWAETLFQLPDFHFYRLLPREVHWIGGFGRQKSWKVLE